MTETINRHLKPTSHNLDFFELPEVNIQSFDNGVKLIRNAGFTNDVIRLELIYRGGFVYEKQKGITYALSKLLTEGTTKYTSEEISREFAKYGSFYDVSSGIEHINFTVYTLSEFIPNILPLISHIIEDAAFPEKEIEHFKTSELQKLNLNKTKTSFLATRKFRAEMFGHDHPYGLSIDKDDIKNINRAKLQQAKINFHQTPVIFVTGNIDEAASHSLESFASNYAIDEEITLPVTPPVSSKTFRDYDEIEGKVQTTIRIGKILFNRNHPDYFKFRVVNEILGGFFGSRLMKKIREESGLTYGIRSSITSYTHAGMLVIGTDVNKDQKDRAMDEIFEEVNKLQRDPVQEDELSNVKNHLKGSYINSINTPYDISNKHKILYLHQLNEDFYPKMFRTFDEITAEDIQQLAKAYLNVDTLSYTLVG